MTSAKINANLALMANSLLGSSGNKSNRSALVTVETAFDDVMRLQGIEAGGRFLGITGEASATISEAGLQGTVTIEQLGFDRTIEHPGIRPDVFQGVQFVSALPAGLQVGERLSADAFSVTMTPPYVGRTTVDYLVREAVVLPEFAAQTLLKVEQSRDNEIVAELIVDQYGVVWQLHHLSTNWTLRLSRHWHADEQIYPPIVAPKENNDDD